MKWEENEALPPPYITCLANIEQNLYFYPNDRVSVLPDISSTGIAAPKTIITGPKNKPVGLKFGKDYLMIKVAFHPTGLYRLLRMPMQKTVNTGLDAVEFWGDEVNRVNEKLGKIRSYDGMIAIVSDFLGKKLDSGIAREEPIDRVAIKMLDPHAKYSLEEWASAACLSLRQFERNFTTRVGLSPKMYIRIVRFENAMKIKNESPGKSWSEVAMDCEYTDPSHMLREFRQFADFPPGSLTQYETSGYGNYPSG